ncbi:MAG: hypothetical protein WCG30_00125 [Candidatus Saccharibacteria bacterium]
MKFKKKKHDKNISHTLLNNPQRLGRNIVKPGSAKDSAFGGNITRRIDDFNRPSGYHSSLPNINSQVAPDSHHSKTRGQDLFSRSNESTDLGSLMDRAKKVSTQTKKPKKSKFKIVKRVCLFILLCVIAGLIIYLSKSHFNILNK